MEAISALCAPELGLFLSPPRLHQYLKTSTDRASNHHGPVAGAFNQQHVYLACVGLSLTNKM